MLSPLKTRFTQNHTEIAKSFRLLWRAEVSDMILEHYALLYEREGVDNSSPPLRLRRDKREFRLEGFSDTASTATSVPNSVLGLLMSPSAGSQISFHFRESKRNYSGYVGKGEMNV